MLHSLSNSIAQTVAAAGEHLVTVDGRRRRSASGIIWSAEGLIVTANHVVEREDNLRVYTPDGQEHAARLIGRDPAIDLALLQIDSAALQPAQWSNSDALQTGQLALAVARPKRSVQVSLGILTAVGFAWRHPGGGRFDQLIQVDVTMYPGFSGGALVAADGSFAGLNSSALARGKTLAIPASNVEKSVAALLAHGHIPRAYLGVGVQPIQLQSQFSAAREAETALMIMSVEPDAPAGRAGLIQGDILLALDDVELTSVEDLQNRLAEFSEPHRAKIAYLRSGGSQEVEVDLAVR